MFPPKLQPLKWPNRCPHQSRCITWRALDTSCPPTQPYSGSRNPPPARHWRAHPCPLLHCHITSVRCWWFPHPPKCGCVTTNHGSSYVRPIRTSNFLHGPKHILRAPHAPFCQTHAASWRRCSQVCPWATNCAKAHSTSRPKGDYADTCTRYTMMCCQFQLANPNLRHEKGEDQTHWHRPTTICSTPHKHKYCHFRKTHSNHA